MTKAHYISQTIFNLHYNQGVPLKEAFDRVLGEGRYEAFISDLYHSLRGE